MRSLVRKGASACVIVCSLWVATIGEGLAQQAIDVCLRGGARIRAAKVEARDGKFILYPEGGGATIELPEDQVKGIGVPCETDQPRSMPAAAAPAQRFGIYGSNTIGERLMPLLIDSFAQRRYGARSAQRPREPEVMDIDVRAAGGSSVLATIDFQAKGSGEAPKALLAGNALIGMMSRRMNDDETARLRVQFGLDIRAPGNEHVLALDGLAVVINARNPIRELTLDQISRIFSGEVTNWMEVVSVDSQGRTVRGENVPIRIHARDAKSGTFDTFKSLVLEPAGGTKRTLSGHATRYESSENLSDAVAKDAGAIGFLGFPYINRNHALAISSACGVSSAPSRFTVKTEAYPLARRLFLYTAGPPSLQIARDLLQFSLSDEAQSVVTEAEFIDQSVAFQDGNEQREWRQAIMANLKTGLTPDKEVPSQASRAFGAAAQLRRSTTVFRFEYGRSDLDVKAVQDVGRLARYLQANPNKAFYAVGFADATGDWTSNWRLSEARAARIVAELGQLGIKGRRDSIVPMSYLAPVACNDTPAGQSRNRRVEIWFEP